MAPLPSPSDDISILHPKVLLLSAGITTSVFLGFKFYRRYLKRVSTYLDITPTMLDNHYPMYGKVTRVGDGDNYRFYHTPGGMLAGWGWLRSVPTTRSGLKDETLMIRLAGIDAPERAHWGKPAQPLSEEALLWLRDYIDGRYVTLIPHSIDQYKRVVGTTTVWKWTGKKDVSAEMIKVGLAVIYESKTGAEFGGKEDLYRSLEKRAKWLERGVWGLHKFQTPGDFKRVHYKA